MIGALVIALVALAPAFDGPEALQERLAGRQGERSVQRSGGPVQTGRTLDANLMVGSGGYNTTTPSYGVFTQPTYGPGMTRDIYTVSRYGEMRYNPERAFSTPRYSPVGTSITRVPGQTHYETRGTQHRAYSPTYHARFRYY